MIQILCSMRDPLDHQPVNALGIKRKVATVIGSADAQAEIFM